MVMLWSLYFYPNTNKFSLPDIGQWSSAMKSARHLGLLLVVFNTIAIYIWGLEIWNGWKSLTLVKFTT